MATKQSSKLAPSVIQPGPWPSWLWTAANHDLRQLLQALQLISSTLPGASPDELKRCAAMIGRLAEIIGQMHEFMARFAKLAERRVNGGTAAALPPVALDDVCRTAIAAVGSLAKDRGIDISATLPAATAAGDRGWLDDAVAGLLLTAIKLTRGKEITVKVVTGPGPGQGLDKARIEIAFDAAPITPRKLRAAFVEVFKPSDPGAWMLGLGLGSIAHLSRQLGIGLERRSTAKGRHRLILSFNENR